jgi:predicted membrane chloride channel (bestrophin family)
MNHDAQDHWWTSLFTWTGTALSVVWLRVMFFVTLTIIFNIINIFYDFPTFPNTAHSLMGVALGLLLVFRTNSAYDRYWEGRKAWQGIMDHTRAFTRMVAASPLVHKLLRTGDSFQKLLPAFAIALKHRLRSGQGCRVRLLGHRFRNPSISRCRCPIAMTHQRTIVSADRPLVRSNLLIARALAFGCAHMQN